MGMRMVAEAVAGRDMPSRVANLPQEYQPPLISDRSRWYSEDPIPIIHLVDGANRQTRVRSTRKSIRAMVSPWPMAVHRQGECRKPAVNRQLGNGHNGGRHKAMRPGRGLG